MLREWLIVCLWASAGAAALFEGARAASPGLRATACAVDGPGRRGRPCEAAVWRLAWALVRASCLRRPRSVYVQKGSTNCTRSNVTEESAAGDACDRGVVARYQHPQYPKEDLAMLRLDWAFDTGSVDNATVDHDVQQKLDLWIDLIATSAIYYTTTERDLSEDSQYLQMYTTPIRMFLITVVLPTVSFIVVFLFIIFFTGSSEKTIELPYRVLIDEDSKSNV